MLIPDGAVVMDGVRWTVSGRWKWGGVRGKGGLGWQGCQVKVPGRAGVSGGAGVG